MQNINETQVTADEALQQAFKEFNATVQTQQPTPQAAPETHATEPAQPVQQEPVTQQDPSPSNQAFAKMRTDLAAMTNQVKVIEAFLKQQGYANIQDYVDKQQQAQLQQQAQQQGISPELEKRIQSLEQENEKYRQNERMNTLRNEVGALVKKYNIDQPGWNNFISQLQAANINPITANVPLETLYVQHNLEYIFNKRLDAEKQVWMQNQTTAVQTAPVSTPQGTPPAPTNPNKKPNWGAMANNFKNSKQ